jgi:hypothetical protein
MVACISNSFWSLVLKERLEDVQTELLIVKSEIKYKEHFPSDFLGGFASSGDENEVRRVQSRKNKALLPDLIQDSDGSDSDEYTKLN